MRTGVAGQLSSRRLRSLTILAEQLDPDLQASFRASAMVVEIRQAFECAVA